jgi:hypothetical protein
MSHITVKDDKPTVIYRYTRKEPAGVIPGVAARDLTDFDLAGYSPDQRLAIHLEAKRDGGAYALKGTVPRGLSMEPDAPAVDTEPAATGKKGS